MLIPYFIREFTDCTGQTVKWIPGVLNKDNLAARCTQYVFEIK